MPKDGNDPDQQQKIAEAKEYFERNYEKYSKEYDESVFQKIVKKLPRKISEPFMKIFYIMKCPEITAAEKAWCVAGLGYVVLPLDIIPDVIPVIGWLDDLGVVAMLLAKFNGYAKTEWVQQQIAAFYGDEIDVSPLD